jgi:hypothetical protein
MAHILELDGRRPGGDGSRPIRTSGPFCLHSATGPGFITGGAFGPEGGLAATVVLLIGIGMIPIRTRRIQQTHGS